MSVVLAEAEALAWGEIVLSQVKGEVLFQCHLD